MKISKTKPLVRQISMENPAARKDDFLLITETIKKLVNNTNLEDLALLHTSWAVPSFETITRCRRAIQKEQPDLKDTNTAKIRAVEEKLFYEEFKR